MAKHTIVHTICSMTCAWVALTASTSAFAGWESEGFSVESTSSGSVYMTPAPAIRIQGLSAFAGKRATIFYVNGNDGSFGTQGRKLKLNSVMGQSQAMTIPSNGELQVAATDVPKAGFRAFNFVALAIHTQDLSTLTGNGDDAVIEPVRYISTDGLQALKQGDISVVQFESCSQQPSSGTRHLLGC